MKKVIYVDELAHHGIKGQKWGKRNGPPYPLGSEDYSAREKKEKYKEAKNKAKTARKEYNRAYNKAYNYSSSHPISQHVKKSKHYQKSRDLWSEERNKNLEYIEANKNKKAAKEEYKTAKSERSTKEISKLLGVSDKDAERIKKYAKIAGISLATTAGLFAAGYLISKNRQSIEAFGKDLVNKYSGTKISSISSDIKNKGKVVFDGIKIQYGEQVVTLNASGSTSAFALSDKGLFEHGGVGFEAARNGYSEIDAGFIKNAIENRTVNKDIASLVKDVRRNQIDWSATRRLSCWSASQSYYMGVLTGKDFTCKSFENLVDFNDFGTLYNTQPKIFNALGKEATDFVGNFGRDGVKFNNRYGKQLVSSVFDNISKSNNLSVDGTRTVGFMNAGYRGITCTHQWNFEILHNADGTQHLEMIDGWAGKRFRVASKNASGVIKRADNYKEFMQELYHYNVDSIRYYAPSIESVDANQLSKIILARA